LLLKRARHSKVLKLNLDPKSYWLFTTRPKDRVLREQMIGELGYNRAFEVLQHTSNQDKFHAKV
jgi:hypothetical protein